MRDFRGAKPAGIFQRIARRDQPPHPVELQSLHRQQAGSEMGLMRRIESSTEQADPHAGRMGRKNALGEGAFLRFHGRV